MPVDHALVRLESGDVVVTLVAAESMRRALLRHLELLGSGARLDHLTELRTNPARIDPDGTVRVGGWLLEGRGDGLAWTERTQHGPLFHVIVAHLASLADGTWQVSALDTEHEPLENR